MGNFKTVSSMGQLEPFRTSSGRVLYIRLNARDEDDSKILVLNCETNCAEFLQGQQYVTEGEEL